MGMMGLMGGMGKGLREGNRGAGTFTGRGILPDGGNTFTREGKGGYMAGEKKGEGEEGEGEREERERKNEKNSLARRINMNESITNPKKRVTFANI